MGMSIDEAIGLLERGSQYNYYDSAEDFCKAYDMAIETMRKYHKIEQIVSDFKEYQKGISCGFGSEVYMQMVSEVVEDATNG